MSRLPAGILAAALIAGCATTARFASIEESLAGGRPALALARITVEESNPTLADHERVALGVLRARALWNQGHADEATATLKQLLEKYPGSGARVAAQKALLDFQAVQPPTTPFPEGGRPARVIRRVDPVFPPALRSAGIEGTVVLRFLVRPNGTTSNISIVKSLEPLLDRSAIDAVAKWEFEAAAMNGNPIASWVQGSIVFQLPR